MPKGLVVSSLTTARLALEPLRVAHAEEMAPLLDDPTLHTFTGGRPATLDQLRDRYASQVRGSPDSSVRWLNWIVRLRATGRPVGFTQATVVVEGGDVVAELSWVIATRYQGCGYATEAASVMAAWLRQAGVDVLVAHVHPDHEASQAVARAIGLRSTDAVVDGEVRWQS